MGRRYPKANSGWPTLRDGLITQAGEFGRSGQPASNTCETTQNAPGQRIVCSYVFESSPLKQVCYA